jgi:hypothetical protein
MVKLKTGKIIRNEMCISPYPTEPVHPRQGNWLIRRLCEVNSIFMVMNDGGDVLYNTRYVFPGSVHSTLQNIKSKLLQLTVPHDSNRVRLASQWYVQNSKIEDIPW